MLPYTNKYDETVISNITIRFNEWFPDDNVTKKQLENFLINGFINVFGHADDLIHQGLSLPFSKNYYNKKYLPKNAKANKEKLWISILANIGAIKQ